MKCVLNTCRITNLQFISAKMLTASCVHPLMGMTDSDVAEALSRLSEYKNVIKKEDTLQDVMAELATREQMLRICGVLAGFKNGMISDHFKSVAYPFEYTLQYLRSRTRTPITQASDMYFLFAHVAAEATALGILVSHYCKGFPQLAELDDGCWGRLLTSCLDEQEDFVESIRVADDLQQRLGWSKMRSSIDYKVLCNKAVSVVRFSQEVKDFLSFVGVPESSLQQSVDYLYWLYFDEAVASKYVQQAAHTLPEDCDEDDSDQAAPTPDDWYDDVKANVLDMILESAVCVAPQPLKGLSAKLSTLYSLHSFSWDVGKALKVALKAFSKSDFVITTPSYASTPVQFTQLQPTVELKRTLRRTL